MEIAECVSEVNSMVGGVHDLKKLIVQMDQALQVCAHTRVCVCVCVCVCVYINDTELQSRNAYCQ